MKFVLGSVVAVLLVAASAAVAWRYGWIGRLYSDPAALAPAAWSASEGWSAEVHAVKGDKIQLRNCRIGDDAAAWLTAPEGTVDGEILTLGKATVAPGVWAALVGWLARHNLPVRVIAASGVDESGAYSLAADRNAGTWVRVRPSGGERVIFRGEGEEGLASGKQLPALFQTWQPILDLAPGGISGDREVRWQKRYGAAAPERVEIRAGGAELIGQPDGWRFTLRDVTWPAPVNLRFHRLTLTGTGGGDSIRMTGEAAASADPELERCLGVFPMDNAAFSGELQNGVRHWELNGAEAAQPYRTGSLSGRTGKWTAGFTVADGLVLEGELAAVTVSGTTFAPELPELHFRGVWKSGRWEGAWDAPRGRIPAAFPGWADGESEDLHGAFPLPEADWRIDAAKAKWRHADPEWSLIADHLRMTPLGIKIQLAALDGLEWQSLWRDLEWCPGSAVTASRMELNIPGRDFAAVAEKPEVTLIAQPDRGVAAVLAARGWSWRGGGRTGQSGSADRSEVARGVIADGRWLGTVALHDFSGVTPPEGRVSFLHGELELPVEFPDAWMRPTASARADAATGLYREAAALAPGNFRSPDVRWEQLTLGSVQAEWKPRSGNAGWDCSGKLALRELAGTELYFAGEEARWDWLLPVAEWSENRLPLYFPGWTGWTLRGMVGLHRDGGGMVLELHDAEFGNSGWLASGVAGEVKLQSLDAPVTAAPATLTFRQLGDWGSGSVQLEWPAARQWRFAALSAAWCGGTVELAAPVTWAPEHDEVTIYPVTVRDVRLDEVLRRFGFAGKTSELRLAGEGEWHWLRDGGWTFGGMALRSVEHVRLQLPEVAGRVAGTNHSADFFRQFLRDFDCRNLRLTWLPTTGGAGMTLKLGVTATPAQPLPFVFSGDEADPLAPARAGEPAFQSEIDFEISLQIP